MSRTTGSGTDDEQNQHPPADAAHGHPRRQVAVTAAAVVVAGLLVLAGYTGALIVGRLGTPGDTSPEAGFARDMSTHHAQAVEMAMIAWQKATDPEVKELAYDIATGQQAQIGVMSTWLQDWHLLPTGSRPKMAWMPDGAQTLRPDGLMPGMATDAQLDQLRQATGKPADILFCQLMIRHHLGGIHMAEAVLPLTHNRLVIDLATAIVRGQQNEIANFTATLTRLGAKPQDS